MGPYDDEKLGFYKIVKNFYYPGWWESNSMYSFFVNSKEWEKLPKEYQAAFEAAAYEANLDMMASYDFKKLDVPWLKFREDINLWHRVAEQSYSTFAAANQPPVKK